jgi:hypothetical protein
MLLFSRLTTITHVGTFTFVLVVCMYPANCEPRVATSVCDINHAALPTGTGGARRNRAIDGSVDHANSLRPVEHLSPCRAFLQQRGSIFSANFRSMHRRTVTPWNVCHISLCETSEKPVRCNWESENGENLRRSENELLNF